MAIKVRREAEGAPRSKSFLRKTQEFVHGTKIEAAKLICNRRKKTKMSDDLVECRSDSQLLFLLETVQHQGSARVSF